MKTDTTFTVLGILVGIFIASIFWVKHRLVIEIQVEPEIAVVEDEQVCRQTYSVRMLHPERIVAGDR